MSIYVEVGVDFPKGCTNCPLCNSEVVCVATNKDLFDSCGKVLLRDGWRPDWCPLFEMDLVYCKNCFWYRSGNNANTSWSFCSRALVDVYPDDYCSYGVSDG